MRDDRRSYLTGAICLLGTNACALFIPWLLKLAVESLQKPATAPHGPAWYGGAIIAIALVHGIIRIFSRTTLLHVARRIEYGIRDDLYARLIQLDQPFFTSGRTGDLMSRFANDLTNVRMLLGFGVLNIIFGSLGLLCSPISILGMPMTVERFGNSPVLKLWMPLSAYLGLVGSVIVLTSGIGLLKYRSWARKLAVYYAMVACLINVIGVFIMIGPLTASTSLSGPERIGGVIGAIFGAVVGVTYNILLIAFLTKRSAREAVGEVTPETS